MTAVKICGINTPEAFDSAVDAGADFLGFVFFPPSPRYVTPDTAAMLSERRKGGPKRVGLFVRPTEDTIAGVVRTVPLDALQLYECDDRQIAAFRAQFNLPIWRAVGVDAASDVPATSMGADYLVIEAKPPPDATRPGGNATTFNWSILRGWHAPVPWMLAAGLTPGNVAGAINATGAAMVDVSSGVEATRGVKDPALIRRFIHAARTVVGAHIPPARPGSSESVRRR